MCYSFIIILFLIFLVFFLKKFLFNHYEKSHLLKPHYLAIKTQKTTPMQLLYNHPLGITTIV
jgi:hypothetical protein